MSIDPIEEQIVTVGNLLSINVFEDRLTKNFTVINSKLKRLQQLLELDNKTKHLEKQLKFLAMKVETIVQKLPKDGGSLNKTDVKLLAKEQMIQLLNSNDDKIVKSKLNLDLLQDIKLLRKDMFQMGMKATNGPMAVNQTANIKTSFTAGQSLIVQEQKKNAFNKDALKNVLDEQEMLLIDQIAKEDHQQSHIPPEIQAKFLDIYTKIEELKMGKGYHLYVEKQLEKFDRFEQYQEKGKAPTKKKPLQLEGIKNANVKGQYLKGQLYSQIQRAQLMREQASKTKTLFPSSLRKQVEYNTTSNFPSKNIIVTDEHVPRNKSIRKLRMRGEEVKDPKQINDVFKQIQSRIQNKVSHDIFMGFIRDFEQKLEMMKFSKDFTVQSNELRRLFSQLESKQNSMIAYLQATTSEDEGLLVKKQWTCVSCDKGLEKYNAKVGAHLNWDQLSSKKISPNKAGAFGQTGQLASKIKNLMQGDAE